MSFSIIPTPAFEKDLKQLAKKYPSLKKILQHLLLNYWQNQRWEHRLVMIAIKSAWLFLLKAKENPAEQELLRM